MTITISVSDEAVEAALAGWGAEWAEMMSATYDGPENHPFLAMRAALTAALPFLHPSARIEALELALSEAGLFVVRAEHNEDCNSERQHCICGRDRVLSIIERALASPSETGQ